MKKNYLKLSISLIVCLFFSMTIYAQSKSTLWTKSTKDNVLKANLNTGKAEPANAIFYSLKINELKTILETAPHIKNTIGQSSVIVDFPMADANFESFRIMESPVMEQILQERYPNMRSYVGQSIQNPKTTIRFSVSPNGLHTMALGTSLGTQYIDPYRVVNNEYMVYSKRDLPTNSQDWICGFDEDLPEGLNIDFDLDAARNANDGMMREYRLALACTVEYSQYHGGTLPSVTDAMMTTITRVNGLYERELSLRMMMVDNTSIIFLGPDVNSDPYSNDDGFAMLDQNQTTVSGNIGSANYDIGHVFSTGGGGVASLNSPCNPTTKARGVTGLPNPIGDAFDIDFVAHEMGHQFGAPHTFNGNTGNCAGGNRNPTTAYEPGSGTTIMAYAGICAPQNVQGNSDDYFHQNSLALIWANISSGTGSTCGSQTATGNSVPAADAGSDYAIPSSTPYRLTGSSTDPDGTGTHTYTWEQYDLGPSGVPTDATAAGPMVRSFEGTDNPTRYIPRLEDILSDGGVSSAWEKLPSVQRNQTFRLTVRDNDARGGQNDFDQMTTNVRGGAGPFLVTSQDTNQIVWTPGETETITWDVAGTTGNAVNTANVNILLSTSDTPDANFDTVLAANVPNNGSFDITVPDVSSPYCRIMVEGAGNIFFNVNDNYFAIGNYTYVPGDICEDYVFNANLLLDENDTTFSGFILTVNDSKTISDFNVSLDVTTTNNGEVFSGIRGPFETMGDNRLASGTCPGSTDLLLTFDDEGMATDCNDTASNDNVLPVEPLSFADGQDSLGDWIFFIGDVIVDGNRATWNSVTLTICEAGGFIPVLSTEEFGSVETFSVFPNPNNGEFTVSFNSTTNSDIGIEVFDIRGRRVLQKTYSNNGSFNQVINLGNVQSGMYLLNVIDGDKKVTKKIIVK